MAKGGLFYKQPQKSVEWYTPAWVFDRLGLMFDLDPCSPVDFETPVPAHCKLTRVHDGLAHSWNGRVWLNPPYGTTTADWMRKMMLHGNGVAMVFARTDSKWFQECMKSCGAMLFIAGRIKFIPGTENTHKASTAGAGTAMFAWGDECVAALDGLRDLGFFIRNG
jgi:hypothetical protein